VSVRFTSCLLWMAVGGAVLSAAEPAPPRPNVVVILADDLGYADVGFNGAKDVPTPHLDQLARQGVRFTSGYVSHPFCSPSRAGLLTGRYQQRFGHENNPVFDPANEKLGLPLDQVTIARVLHQAGYVTAAVGKWHLGAAPQFHPMKRGFDEYFGLLGGGHDYFKAASEGDSREYQIPIQRNGQPVELKEYLTDVLTREAVAVVRRYRDRPFFLYLAYNAPHTPLQVTRKYLDRVGRIEDPLRRPYAAMVCSVDDGLGAVVAALDEMKLTTRTLVFFLSDNGGPTAVTHSRNDPLRGAKGSVYEGGIRVPFVARWTGRLPAGAVYAQPVIALDILPTAAAAAGAELPQGAKLDGVNLLPHVCGEDPRAPHETLFWRTGGGQSHAARSGRWKLVKTAGGPVSLYDLEADVGESKDLAPAEPQRVEELSRQFAAWNAQLVPPLWENPRQAKKAASPKKQPKRARQAKGPTP